MELGKVGIWWSGRWRSEETSTDVAPEMESLGYSTLWSSGGFEPGLAKHFERLLAATTTVNVASGILSIWMTPAADLSAEVAALEERFPGRFLAGLGVSHAVRAENYARPYSHMVSYLDDLDAAAKPLNKDRRILAALRPRMLELSRDRSLGAHPYFVPAEYIGEARSIVGERALLAPSVTVVVESDASKARETARTFTAHYLALPNYSNNLRSSGFTDNDLVSAGSDRLVDALVCWGSLDTIAEKLRRYFQAGADHICIQVLNGSRTDFPTREYRELASALLPKGGTSS